MKCPNCGFEIPEGHMYCDNCGTEINFVPDFEPEVENEINATLSGVADELNKDDRIKEEKIEKKKAFYKWLRKKSPIIISVTVLIVVLCLIATIIYSFSGKTAFSYMRSAESQKNSGNVDEAIATLIEGNRQFPENSDIIFRLSDYYLEIDDSENAVNALKMITESAVFPDETVANAYESIISIYKQSSDYASIADVLNDSTDEIASSLREKYVPLAPSIEPTSGEYDDYVTVTIKANNQAPSVKIYYTVNDGDPDENSILYENEIVIDSPGEYSIKAVCINEYGIASSSVTREYSIVEGLPAAPEILEPSGDYNQNTMIVAVAEEGCTIYYTTDGTDPTIQSKQYVSPITMPVGTTNYKFVAINADGEMSEIVERSYHLVFTRLVSTEQAVTALINTLVRLDYLLDDTGKVRGLDGYHSYIYDSVIEIAGAGEYYSIVEYHVNTDGTSAPTGLLYAVNTHDGSVNRLGYDSSGKYTLLKISNR